MKLRDKLLGLNLDAQPRQSVVAIHHHMHERVEGTAVIALSTRAVVDIESPDGEECSGVVVDVEEGYLRTDKVSADRRKQTIGMSECVFF